MISVDRKMIRRILKLTHSMKDYIWYEEDAKRLVLTGPSTTEKLKTIDLNIDPSFVRGSLSRLAKLKMISFHPVDASYFRITDRMILRRAFWFDSFSKKFWGGFITGFAVEAAVNLSMEKLPQVIEAIVQLIQSLL